MHFFFLFFIYTYISIIGAWQLPWDASVANITDDKPRSLDTAWIADAAGPDSAVAARANTHFVWDFAADNSARLKQFVTHAPPESSLIINKTHPDDTYIRQNATVLVLTRNSDLFSLLETLQNVEDRFNHKFHYDYTFLNDVPFDPEFIYLVASHIPQGTLNFGVVPQDHWTYPAHIDQDRAHWVRQHSQHYPYGASESYRHMCRFYSGFFYRHPLVAQYQYYWRIEPGVRYYCNIDEDLFAVMKAGNKKYGFAVSLFEYSDTIPSLWDTVKAYMREHAPPAELVGLVQNDDVWESYNLCHFWTNFEIADLAFFRSPEYQHFFEYLDRAGGFYYERWGDAPVHTMALAMYGRPEDIQWFGDIGYYHPPYTKCPQEPAVFVDRKCTCDPDDDFTDGFLSCTPHFLQVLAHSKT